MQKLLSPFNKLVASIADLLNWMPRWAQHVLFWGVMSLMTRNQFLRMYTVGEGAVPPNMDGFWVLWPVHLLYSMAAFYVLGYYVVPRFWNRQRGFQFLLLFAVYWQISYLQMQWTFELIQAYFPPVPHYLTLRLSKMETVPFYSTFVDSENFFVNWAYNFAYVIIALLIKAKRDETTEKVRMLGLEQEKQHMQQENAVMVQANMLMEQEKIKMEMSFLRAQINPHFLFNAFNNLYALILDNDKQAGTILNDLSDMMRYALYRTNAQYVSLTDELDFLANYIQLESIRFNESKTIDASVTGDARPWLIPPMIIITFMENAVKHGLNQSTANARAWVNYSVKIGEDGTFYLNIRNSKSEGPRKRDEGGIGIANVRKRLDILMKDQYTLLLDDEPGEFSVTLILPLRPLTDITPVYELIDYPDPESSPSVFTQKAIPA